MLATAQVITVSPAFATRNDTVEIIFNALQGNAELVGENVVYAHTGVIKDGPTSTNWQNVQGNWGTADNKVKMTNLGANLHRIRFHIPTFYGLSANDTVHRLAFVFRNADGSKVGRNADGSDIFTPIYSSGFQVVITQPIGSGIYNVNDSLDISGVCSANADLKLFHGTTLLKQETSATQIDYKLPLIDYGVAKFPIVLSATVSGNTFYDTIHYLARAGVNIGVDTLNGEEGLTVIGDSGIYLKLRAPLKNYVYLIGSFNNWELSPEYELKRTPDGEYFWTVINGLDPEKEHLLQYYIDQEGLRIADPYSEKVLDPWNDPFISSATYPNLQAYPSGKTDFPVTAFKINDEKYQWVNSSFKKPNKEELVIYEMLIRDFDDSHSYQSVIGRLDYLDSLGINAIELMPIMEFEGNESWGYNPMFFMAPDKYYGTKNDFKSFVDSCHSRGIAVILDIALNHAFGQCPLVRMYFDPTAGQYGQPTPQSPWFNEVAKHDFNVGYDFNHESDATKYFARRVFQHWVQEYKIDGYRVDLSKGFTQNNTLGNISAFAQYDAGRIAILSRLKDDVHEVDSTAYMILEHFANNDEEIELSSRGFMLWGNENHQYNEATMGYPNNLGSVYHKNRAWSKPHLVGYMESHDEERLMYKNLNYGNSNGSYNTKDPGTALKRMELGAAFFFTIPGPKMIWQFGEMGYDYSINYCPNGTVDPGCRLANKPIRWDYLDESARAQLVDRYGDLLSLRNRFPKVFQSDSASINLGGMQKSVILKTEDSSAVVIGNFGLSSAQINVEFPTTGWWYDYFNGDSIQLSTLSVDTTLSAGEYHIFTNFKTLESTQTGGVDSTIYPVDTIFGDFATFFPNPAGTKLSFIVNLPKKDFVFVKINTPDGKLLFSKTFYNLKQGYTEIKLSDYFGLKNLRAGVYYYSINSSRQNQSGSLFISY